jgi:glycosyltransferase involved in cell wall biosynthesis
MKPKISVIIPVYNAVPYLRRCLDSVTGQTLRDIEILCVNDASTDASLDILNKYAAKDVRIRIFHNDKNLGAAGSRNLAMAEGCGEYIAFVDSDDAIDIHFLKKLYCTACDTQMDVVKGVMCLVAADGRQSFSKMNRLINKFGKIAFSTEFWTAIYKNSFLKKHNIVFPDSVSTAEDYVFITRTALKIDKISFVDDAYYMYYRRNDSKDSLFLNIEKIISKLQAYNFTINEINNSYKKNIADDEYDYMYTQGLLRILYLVTRNDTQNCKQKCAESMVAIYNQCRRPDILRRSLYAKYPIMHDLLCANDIGGLAEFLGRIRSKHALPRG